MFGFLKIKKYLLKIFTYIFFEIYILNVHKVNELYMIKKKKKTLNIKNEEFFIIFFFFFLNFKGPLHKI